MLNAEEFQVCGGNFGAFAKNKKTMIKLTMG